MKKRILITGATGMLGATMTKRFKGDFDVFATGSKEVQQEFFENYMAFDLASLEYSKLIEWSKPDVIIHCAALTNGNYCNENPEEAFLINGLALKKLTDASPITTHVVYISTDAVFSNITHNASETDIVFPESIYGKSKELGEFYLKHLDQLYTIVRTTIVGLNLSENRQGFVEWIINASINNQQITLFDDVVFNPISIWNLCDQIKFIVENPKQYTKKTLHIAGSQVCTKFKFGTDLLKALDLPIEMVKNGKISDFADRAKRSTDQTLDCKYFEQLSSRKLPNLNQTIEELKDNYNEAHEIR